MMLKNTLFGAVVLAAILTSAILAGCGAKPAPQPGEGVVAVSSSAPAAAATNPAELFKQSCGVCHKIEKAVAYSGKTPWKELVDRMIQHGAKITPENAALIVKHLDATYPRQKPATF